MARYSKSDREEAIKRLREWLKPGDTVNCILRHVSSSGMSRTIQLVKIEDGNPTYLGWSAAAALEMPYDMKREGVKVGGAGMDMGFHLVYNVGRVLFPDGFGLRSEPHKGGEHRATPCTPEEAETLRGMGFKFYGRNGDSSGWDYDGGYALTHRWL